MSQDSLFFGVIDDYLFKVYMSYLLKNSEINFNLNQILPLNFRINTDLTILYEVFNFYFYEFKEKINVYIKKLYGETELYECSTDSKQLKDFSILTTPISNCKNKKSLLNRLFSFEGTRIISGYLGHDSFFDIYADIDDKSTEIKIYPMLKGRINSATKYLKKGIVYTLNFTADHLVKIDPGFNAEVSIYNGKDPEIKLNSKK